jgi:hypothetical protein
VVRDRAAREAQAAARQSAARTLIDAQILGEPENGPAA